MQAYRAKVGVHPLHFGVLVIAVVALVVAMRVKLIYRSECVVLFKTAIKTSERGRRCCFRT